LGSVSTEKCEDVIEEFTTFGWVHDVKAVGEVEGCEVKGGGDEIFKNVWREKIIASERNFGEMAEV
jgi:hypothetical protein